MKIVEIEGKKYKKVKTKKGNCTNCAFLSPTFLETSEDKEKYRICHEETGYDCINEDIVYIAYAGEED